jgi:hypothetical protein
MINENELRKYREKILKLVGAELRNIPFFEKLSKFEGILEYRLKLWNSSGKGFGLPMAICVEALENPDYNGKSEVGKTIEQCFIDEGIVKYGDVRTDYMIKNSEGKRILTRLGYSFFEGKKEILDISLDVFRNEEVYKAVGKVF